MSAAITHDCTVLYTVILPEQRLTLCNALAELAESALLFSEGHKVSMEFCVTLQNPQFEMTVDISL